MGKKSELDDLRARLATLEAEVDRLRGGATATGTTAAATEGPGCTKARPAPKGRTRVLDAVREEQAAQLQSMTRIADVLGVMLSGRVEEPTRVLRGPAEVPEGRCIEATETRNAPPAAHGQFLESLLEGRPALQQ
jgi:hypothetical protein